LYGWFSAVDIEFQSQTLETTIRFGVKRFKQAITASLEV
jgi:hypothetical protein